MYFCECEDDPYTLIGHMSLDALARLIVARDDVRQMVVELLLEEPSPVSYSFEILEAVTAPTMRARGMVTPSEDIVVSSGAVAA